MSNSNYAPQTVAAIAAVLQSSFLTARQIQAALPLDHSRGTIRDVLRKLTREGRAEICGDITQRYYRKPEAPCPV